MMILRGGHDFFLLGFRGGAIENFFVCRGRYKGGGHRKINEIFNHSLLM